MKQITETKKQIAHAKSIHETNTDTKELKELLLGCIN